MHPGEVRQVIYEVVNTTDRAVTGQANPSYGPQSAAEYFRKLECFCFTQQTLQPGERRQMPVVFVIDPKLPRDMTDDHAVVHVLRSRGQRQLTSTRRGREVLAGRRTGTRRHRREANEPTPRRPRSHR